MSTDMQALQATADASQRTAASARDKFRRIQAEAAGRAARFRAITLQSGLKPTEIRDFADQVHLADPATIEDAAVEVARAEKDAVYARYAVLEASRPALEAEVERCRLAAVAADEAWKAARMAATVAQPQFNGEQGEKTSALRQVQEAEQAAKAGADRRLAQLAGEQQQVQATPARGTSLTQYALIQASQ